MVINQNLIDYQEKKKIWPIFRKGRLSGGIIFEKVEKRSYLSVSWSQLERSTVRIRAWSLSTALIRNFQDDGEALYQKMVGGGWKPIYDGTELRSIRNGYSNDYNEHSRHRSNALLEALEKNQATWFSGVMEVNTGQRQFNLSKNSEGLTMNPIIMLSAAKVLESLVQLFG